MQKVINQIYTQFSLRQWLLLIVLLLWTSLFFIKQTNLAASDLGRHITNGRVILETGRVFSTNLYSYTNPDFFAPNHHWLFGVVAAVVHQTWGFGGLTILSSLIYTSALAVIWLYAAKRYGFTSALAAALIALPLYVNRTEIRPEFFSLFFFSILLVLFLNWLNKLNWRSYLVLMISGAVIMAAWVNIHIFFVLTGVLGLAALIHLLANRFWSQLPFLMGLAVVWGAATMVNPLGWQGAFYPFVIFTNYGYRVAENQPIWFFLRHFTQPIHWYLVGSIVFGLALSAKFYWQNFKQHAFVIALSVMLIGLSSYMIRFHNLLGLVMTLTLAVGIHGQLNQFKNLAKNIWQSSWRLSLAGLFLTTYVLIMVTTGLGWPFHAAFGLGLMPNYFASIEFMKRVPLHGQMFNNFDSGSFLIFSLFPERKVFIDNRAEAYPADFVQNKYIAAQENDKVWQQVQDEYDLGSIYFYRHDMTNWGQEFLVKRVQDPAWIPVFVDNYVIIFVKDIPEHQTIIAKYRLPDELFTVTKPN